MTDGDLKSRAWRAELPALDTLLSTAELDAPPPELEARLLRGLREAEPFEAAPVPSEAEAMPDSAAVAAEPVPIPSVKLTGPRVPRLWLGVGTALVAAAAVGLFLQAGEGGDGTGQASDRRSSSWPLFGMASRDGPQACTGTYFIRASNGSSSFWTFHPEGTLLGTSLADRDRSLGTQHGSWRAEGSRKARALQLGLHVTASGTLAGVERADITLRGENAGCNTVKGESSRRWFEPGQDFLHPDQHPGALISFTGFRIDVTP